MNTLTPQQAAGIAEGVYRLRSQSIGEMQRIGERLGCEGLFKSGESLRFLGSSGAVVKATTGFGYITEGEGAYSGQVLCVTRGTATMYDWASNLNIGVQVGPGGHLVHAGFNDIWKTTTESVRGYLKGKNPSHIHCIGHSLGGALAMLNADFFTKNRVAGVTLYTFGCPRVGLDWFATSLTTRLGDERVFRVSHIADPVPMIPILPFIHVPTTTSGYMLGTKGSGGFISAAAHGMLSSYIPRVGEKTWDALRSDERPASDREVQDWLATTSGGNSVLMHSAEALRMIGRVLRWILGKAAKLIEGVVGVGLTGAVTLLDQIAWMIARGAQLSKELASYGVAMIRAIFKFLGRAVSTAYELTVSFLRWVMQMLFATLGGLASRALSLV